MTEEELSAALGPLVSKFRDQIAAEDAALVAAENKIGRYELFLARISAMATEVPDGANGAEAAAFGIIDDCLAPVEARLETAKTTIAALNFVVQVPDELEVEAIALLSDLTSGAENYLEQIETVFEPVVSAFETAVGDIQTKTAELSELVAETIDDAISSADDLQNRLAAGIPEATAPVAQLIDDEFSAELQNMADQADALIASVQQLVSGASNALETSLGGVTDLLKKVNELVQPLDPAFDAMEILRG